MAALSTPFFDHAARGKAVTHVPVNADIRDI